MYEFPIIAGHRSINLNEYCDAIIEIAGRMILEERRDLVRDFVARPYRDRKKKLLGLERVRQAMVCNGFRDELVLLTLDTKIREVKEDSVS